MSSPPPPSPWFRHHAAVVQPGMQVLDIACGHGRHAIAAARLGADVVAIDADAQRLAAARRLAAEAGVNVTWQEADLTAILIPPASFDLVLVFNYLDRARMPDFRAAVRPGGRLMAETFLDGQPSLGWGPTSPDHLLRPGELLTLVAPLEVEFAREVVEVINDRAAVLASVVARRLE